MEAGHHHMLITKKAGIRPDSRRFSFRISRLLLFEVFFAKCRECPHKDWRLIVRRRSKAYGPVLPRHQSHLGQEDPRSQHAAGDRNRGADRADLTCAIYRKNSIHNNPKTIQRKSRTLTNITSERKKRAIYHIRVRIPLSSAGSGMNHTPFSSI